MYKKTLALFLVMVMVLTVFQVTTFAAPGNVHQVTNWPDGKAKLLGGTPEWVFFNQGNPPSNGIAAIWTPEELDSAEKEVYFAKVKAADPSIGNIQSSASVFFFYGDQIATNNNNNTGKYQVGEIDGEWYLFVLSGGLSHAYYSEGKSVDPRVKVEVTAEVIENFRKIVLQDQYKYDVQDFYQYDVQDFYQYDVQNFYQYDVQDFYQYDVQDFYQYDVQNFYQYDVQNFYQYDAQDFYQYDVQNFYERDAQKFYIPVFEKKTVQAGKDTLVTWRNNKTVPGGTFGNGMTYLEINTEKAKNEGYTFGIADSSPSNNYVGYDYNVKIEGNDLVISFDDRFIGASATAKVYTAAPKKHDPSGHKTLLTGDELRIKLPAAGANTYYLFFHLASGVSFYETGDYSFVDWRLAETQYGEYGLVDTITGENYLVETVNGKPYFVSTKTSDPYLVDTVTGDSYLVDTVVGDSYLVNTETGDRYLVDTVTGDRYLADTVTSDPYLVNTATGDTYFVETVTGDSYLVNTVTSDNYLVAKDVEISDEAGTRPYTGTLTLTVDGVEQPLNEAFYLKPGEYEFALNFAGRTVTENWTVTADGENKFVFETQYIDGLNEISYAADLVEENKLADVTTENKLADVTTENKLADVITENKLADVMTDKWLSDVYRGSEDPEDLDSIQHGIYTPGRN